MDFNSVMRMAGRTGGRWWSRAKMSIRTRRRKLRVKKVFSSVLNSRQQSGTKCMGGGQLPSRQMLKHHGGIETAIPHFRGAVVSGFKSEVDFQALIASLRGSSGVVFQFPLFGIPGRDVNEPGVVLHGKMDSAAPFGVRAGSGASAGFGAAVHQRAAEFRPVFGKLHTVMSHFETGHADRDVVRANGEIIFILEIHAPLFIQGNKGNNILPTAVFVDGHGVVGRVKKQFGDFVLRQKSLHGEEAVKKAKGIVVGSRLEQRKYRQIAFRVGSSEHIEDIPVVKAASAGVPADIAVRLGVKPAAVTGGNAALLAVAQPLFRCWAAVTTGVPSPERASSEGVSSPLSTDSFKNSC